MPRFVYKAKVDPVQFKEGVIEAETVSAAIYKISKMGYFPVDVREELSQPASKKIGIDTLFFYNSKKITPRELSLFTRQLADLLGSGLTLLKALDVLSRQADNMKFKSVVDDIFNFVREGGTFSAGLARHKQVFSDIYSSMVKAGEAGGMLEDVLNRLADYAQTQDQLRDRIRSALVYPALMSVVGAATILVLLTFVIPRLVTIFDDMGQALPIPTLILIRMSSFITHYGWIILAALIISGFILHRRSKTKDGKFSLDNFKLKMPGIGLLIKKAEIARFTRTLSTLLTNGVSMMQSLEVAGSTVENEVLRREISQISKDVAEGVSFSKSITKASAFPLFISNMIAVGDESGHLEKALLKVAEACERDVDRTARIFTALLEPVIILVMGSIVGFIVISMLLPIFQINLMAR